MIDKGTLLTSAILAVVEGLRMNPDRHPIIFNNSKFDNNHNIFDFSSSPS
ncbi:MAG: hypothetical protein WBZ20_15135 [Nitrososphaeraceae archaeon]